MQGKFITFEGIDGSGKSTQLRMLADNLRARGLDVVTTREPGGTPLGIELRKVFLETRDDISSRAELLLFAADRAQHVEFFIEPAIKNGKIVISDRYADATYTYQGAGRGFPEELVLKVIDLATGGLKPDLTVFFDITVYDAVSRMASRDENQTKKNRMDEESEDFYERVRNAYLKIAQNEPQRFRIIDASGNIDEIQMRVLEVVLGALEK